LTLLWVSSGAVSPVTPIVTWHPYSPFAGWLSLDPSSVSQLTSAPLDPPPR
jgi:hypothetical protein